MKIYLDETYDHNHTWLILGGLFNPHHKKFFNEIKKLLMKEHFILPNGRLREIKYNWCYTKKTREVYEKVIDKFIDSDSYFAAVAIRTDNSLELHRYGDATEPDKIKRQRVYRTLAEHLLNKEMREVDDAVLFLDKMSRCDPKQFMNTLKQNFCIPDNVYSKGLTRPRIRHIQDVVSGAEGYELMGVCDLLQGCILNNLFPIKGSKNKGSMNKNLVREYLVKKIGIRDLTVNTWVEASKKVSVKIRNKFNIRYVKQSKEVPKKEKGSG